jgi:hypothetical protein
MKSELTKKELLYLVTHLKDSGTTNQAIKKFLTKQKEN